MKVKELKEELEYYDDDMDIRFEVDDDFEPDSVTEDKYGNRSVHLTVNVRPCFICDRDGCMLISLDKER